MLKHAWLLGIGLVLATIAGGVPAAAQEFPLRLLDEGKPLADATVRIEAEETSTLATDASGSVTVPVDLFGPRKRVTVWEKRCVDGRVEYVIVEEGREPADEEGCTKRRVGEFLWGAGASVVDVGATPAATAPSPGDGISWYVLGKYEFRHFYKWEDISGDDPAVATHDATSSSHGAGVYVGARLGDLPVWAMLGGYYAGGLETDTTLDTGHHIRGEVDQYALGGGLRFLFHPDEPFNPYLWLGGLYTWNKGDFEEVNAVTTSDHRVFKSWTGEYGIGGTYWVRPRLGLDFGLSYNGQFDGENADENVRASFGMIYNGGAVCGGQCGGRR